MLDLKRNQDYSIDASAAAGARPPDPLPPSDALLITAIPFDDRVIGTPNETSAKETEASQRIFLLKRVFCIVFEKQGTISQEVIECQD
jgi:hypothetical protein